MADNLTYKPKASVLDEFEMRFKNQRNLTNRSFNETEFSSLLLACQLSKRLMNSSRSSRDMFPLFFVI